MDFRILGPLEVVHEDRLLPLRGGRQRALLALLILRPNEVIAAERLIAELWPAGAPPTAAKIVQTYVSDLRKALPDAGVLATHAPGYVLRIDAEGVDARRFERLLNEGARALAAGTAAEAAAALGDALSLWRGPPLVEFAYESFAQAEIARLEELRLVALEHRIEADLALGRELDVLGELEALVSAHPLRERLRGQQMLALYRVGRQREALQVFQGVRRALSEELGIEPGPSLRELEQQILAQDPALGAPRRGSAAPDPGAEGARLVTLVCAALEAPPAGTGGGDEAARRLLDLRDRVLPDEIRRRGGRPLERVAGDAVAAFGSARDAVAFAVSLRALAGEQEMEVRIGMGLGETASGEPLGAALGAGRLAGRAGAGQILLTQAVKNLCGVVGGVEFRRAGRMRLRGYQDPWEVFEAVPAGEAPQPAALGARLRRRLRGAGP